MQLEQNVWSESQQWENGIKSKLGLEAQLVLVFGSRAALSRTSLYDTIRQTYPNAFLMGCSTAGEICGTHVLDDSLVVTAVHFQNSRIKGGYIKMEPGLSSREAGRRLAEKLEKDDLAHVFVLSDGLGVNGSELVAGLTANLPDKVSVTGGLAADGALFQETSVFWNEYPAKDTVAVLGLYGKSIRVGYGSMGGWDPFGPERLITRSTNNILYELDGQSALELYKKYLGEHAKGLPATGLLFPLSMRNSADDQGVVRTILAVNESESSMTFAGDLPEGSYVRFMKANFDRLVEGASGAAKSCLFPEASSSPRLAVLISCVGRKLVLKQRVEEEIESVQEVLGKDTCLTGFYSYGEISPFALGEKCELHNQTMTITTFSED